MVPLHQGLRRGFASTAAARAAQDPAVTEARAFNGFGTNFEGSPEPIYGQLFLPRKFKIAVTVPGDNSVDLLTNDLGIVVIADEAGAVLGYDLLVGGGMGRTNRRALQFLLHLPTKCPVACGCGARQHGLHQQVRSLPPPCSAPCCTLRLVLRRLRR
jgi:hypothetical protein